MKVLVTGATGFIGKHLVSFLLNHGLSVRILVRHPLDVLPEKVEQHLGDLTKPITLNNIADDIDAVFHLGGYSHAWKENAAIEAERHRQVNSRGTHCLFEECIKAGVKKFIFFSSIKAVADSNDCINEQWNHLPDSPYGKAKKSAEDFILAMGKLHDIHVCVLRLALVYGPGWKGNLYQMLRAIDKGYFLALPPVQNRRSLVSVYDVCQAAWLAMQRSEANGKIYFVTDKETYSTYEIYLHMRAALGRSKPRWHIPLWMFKSLAFVGDQFEKILRTRFPFNSQAFQKLFGSSQYSSMLIQQELGFFPEYPLQKLLPDIVKVYREGKS